MIQRFMPGPGLYVMLLSGGYAVHPASAAPPRKKPDAAISPENGIIQKLSALMRGNAMSAAPYSVFQGFSDVFENFEGWLGKVTSTRVHGHLFAPDRVEFAGGEAVFNGVIRVRPIENLELGMQVYNLFNTFDFRGAGGITDLTTSPIVLGGAPALGRTYTASIRYSF